MRDILSLWTRETGRPWPAFVERSSSLLLGAGLPCLPAPRTTDASRSIECTCLTWTDIIRNPMWITQPACLAHDEDQLEFLSKLRVSLLREADQGEHPQRGTPEARALPALPLPVPPPPPPHER